MNIINHFAERMCHIVIVTMHADAVIYCRHIGMLSEDGGSIFTGEQISEVLSELLLFEANKRTLPHYYLLLLIWPKVSEHAHLLWQRFHSDWALWCWRQLRRDVPPVLGSYVADILHILFLFVRIEKFYSLYKSSVSTIHKQARNAAAGCHGSTFAICTSTGWNRKTSGSSFILSQAAENMPATVKVMV